MIEEELQAQTLEAPIEAAPPQLGELLIAARERWNLSDADLARQMRLALRQVQAMEANRFAELPGNTFVRGFIRNYARVVQSDAEPFLEAYERCRPRQQQPEIAHHNEQIAFPSKTLPKWLWYLGILLLMALIAPLLIYLALHDDETPTKPAKPSVGPSTAPQAAQSAAVPFAPPQAVLQSAGPGPVSAAQSSVPNTPAAPAAPSASAPAVQSGPGVTLNFDGDAWVEIRDKSGKIVFSKLSRRGETQWVPGTPPFSLVVGNAAQVRIAYNGKPFDLGPYTKVNVARFKLE
jgi:cytoskeleton protein RodZ